jgi:hypothetical protein
MSRKTIQVLAATIVVLIVLLYAIRSNDGSDAGSATRLLIPDLESVANTATDIRISGASGDPDVQIHRDGDTWLIGARDDYAADLGKIRQLIIALADAKIMEEKTSDEDKYARLGVGDPENGGDGLEVSIAGPEFSYSVILGKTAQRKSRYARIKGEAVSYLIDQNPDIPSTAAKWLLTDLVDIDSKRIKSVSISHVGGDTLRIEKDTQEQNDFVVRDVPKNRELSYSTVGNGIASALGNLKLEDVRKQVDSPAATTTVYRTWDGLMLTVGIVNEDGAAWATFSASDAAEAAGPDETPAPDASGRAAEAEAINTRLSGWQYRLPEYKTGLITREWKDILKADGKDPAKP